MSSSRSDVVTQCVHSSVCSWFFFWEKLFSGTVPPNNTLIGRTVLPNNTLFVGTAPPNYTLFGRTVLPNSTLFGGTPDSDKWHLFKDFMNLKILAHSKENLHIYKCAGIQV